MEKIFLILILAAFNCQLVGARPINETDRVKALEDRCSVLQSKQVNADNKLQKLAERQNKDERQMQTLLKKNEAQHRAIDSLQEKCKSLEEAQSMDRDSINGKIKVTNTNVQTNQDRINTRTWIGVIAVIVVIAIVIGIAFLLSKRIKLGSSTIDDIRKAQEGLQTAQEKMQEESVKLDNQLLDVVQKQLEASKASTNNVTGEPDHSLIIKLANEIARIETNLSKMDKSVRGYKQLVQAKDRMINNVRAYGYEIISLVGQDYNDGMEYKTRFVPDESLPEGKRVISGMVKMQVNYNGKMIQPAEIVVRQNI